jgi:hypothetical protein
VVKRKTPAVAVVAAALLAVVMLAALVYRNRLLAERPLLPVAFVHGDHRQVACADCHHNFIDGSGGGACYNCHKMDPLISDDMEWMFHRFCRECHVRQRIAGEESGPLRECSLCHRSVEQQLL